MLATDLLSGMVTFVSVVRSGSFTKAAQDSGHSTSFISKEINKLEARLGVRLLHRTTRSLSLTPEGELYFRQCEHIVQEAELAEQALGGRQLEPKGTLRLTCPVSFGLSRLRPVLAQFIEQYPQVQLELDLNDRKVDMVAEGFDLAIRASGQLEDSSLICRRFMKSQGVVLAAPKYLKKFGTPKHPEELREHKVISYSNLSQPNVWTFEHATEPDMNVSLNCQVITNSPELELSLCVEGAGITRLPLFNLEDELQTGQLVELFPDYKRPVIDIFLVYPSRKHMSAKVRCFIDFILETFTDES
ncbi:LysR family transcriptional regulator [Pleionea sp. CnH1-48]|uniref:LysR family transcriptional regulator n=1 Tax=Pleionea sp. CnH1-48 TaxID=2954494 RepID=UPI002096AD31|nr:LysR family transcriptional regulator [Pleionea sp. CnH1-48]MCO7227416.1 LysR family transcriptional regulator [Pleionea sp. CnH1-48]